MAIQAHAALTVARPDEVAECWEGVLDSGLYPRLWSMVESYDNAHLANIEDMGPHDVIGINSVATFWDKFTEEEQAKLNALAVAQDAYVQGLGGEATRPLLEDWQYEVANGDTRLGYEQWAEIKREGQ